MSRRRVELAVEAALPQVGARHALRRRHAVRSRPRRRGRAAQVGHGHAELGVARHLDRSGVEARRIGGVVAEGEPLRRDLGDEVAVLVVEGLQRIAAWGHAGEGRHRVAGGRLRHRTIGRAASREGRLGVSAERGDDHALAGSDAVQRDAHRRALRLSPGCARHQQGRGQRRASRSECLADHRNLPSQ